VAVSEIDRNLLERCLTGEPKSWEDFVDRFLGLVIHVINHASHLRSIRLTPQDQEDLASEVFLAILEDDFAVLRHFRGESSLATYLTVVARRAVVRSLVGRRSPSSLSETSTNALPDDRHDGTAVEKRFNDRDEVERLIQSLNGHEAAVVRMYHLEGRSYREISDRAGIPENSIGPTLTRARAKMRQSHDRLASA